MFKFTTDKNNRRKMESEWDHGYFLGVNPGTTEYLIGFSVDVYSCATMRRLEEDKAFDAAVIKELDMHYRDYVIQGARSSPVQVRLPATGSPTVDPEECSQSRGGPSSIQVTSHVMATPLGVLDASNCNWHLQTARTIRRNAGRGWRQH